MSGYLCLLAAMCASVAAAPPAPPRLYQQHGAPAQLQSLNPIDYFIDNPEVPSYYHQTQQKQANGPNEAPARLETLEPDSEVELIPGAQQPQQPPQQTPVNVPGLVPGQRVFIVHMPVPGYRPGSIGGYQPVYIVAAAPQANNGYAANGYQNAVLLNPAGQVVNPYFGYPGVGPQAAPSGLLVGAPFYNRGPEQVYQDPAFVYQQGVPQGSDERRAIALNNLANLQTHPAPASVGVASETSNPEAKRAQPSEETKEAIRNARPSPPHAQQRPKA